MMAYLQKWILLANLVSLSLSQSTSSSSLTAATSATKTTISTPTTTSRTVSIPTSLQTPHPLSDYVWDIPFFGMSDNASNPWGLLGVLSEYTYSITVNDSNPVPSISGSTLSTNNLVEAKAEHNRVEDRDYELLLLYHQWWFYNTGSQF
jgi:hypothetical protein